MEVLNVNNKRKRFYTVSLVLILTAGAIVRCWGIDFGLPLIGIRPDEGKIIKKALSFGLGDLNPHFFNYPTLYMYVLFFLYGFYYLIGTISGKFLSASDFGMKLIENPTDVFLIARYFSALLGTLTIFITYKVGKNLFNKQIALISSCFLSFTYLHVRDSHFGVTDVPMTFLIMCSFLYIVKSYEDKSYKNYIIAGVFTGLATSTKYVGILLLIPMLLAHLFNFIKEGKAAIFKLFFNRRILFFFAFLLIAFFIGTPFALFDYRKFVSDFLFEMRHLHAGHNGILLGRGWWCHLKFSLFHGMGWSLLFSSLIGILVLFKTDVKKAMLLFCFPIVYYVSMGRGYTVFVRYIIPLIPFLCVGAAIFIVYLNDKFNSYLKPALKNILLPFIAALMIVPSVYNIIMFDKLLALKDNRLIVLEWISRNIPEGSSIYTAGMRSLIKDEMPITYLLQSAKKGLKGELEPLDKNIAVLQYEKWMFDKESKRFTSNGVEQFHLPDYIIIGESPLKLEPAVPGNIKRMLKSSYYLKESFKAIDMSVKKNLFDRQDRFYVPFAGFKKVLRPGPNIYIYSRK